MLSFTSLFFIPSSKKKLKVIRIEPTVKAYTVPVKNQNDYSLEYEKLFAYLISVPMHKSPKEIIAYQSKYLGKFIKKDSAYITKIKAFDTEWEVKLTFPNSNSIEAELNGTTTNVIKLLSYFNKYKTIGGAYIHHDTIKYSGYVPTMHIDHDTIVRKNIYTPYDRFCGGNLKSPLRFYSASITVDTITRHATITLK